MFRIVGIGMIVCGSAGLGFALSRECAENVKTLETIRQFVMLLHGETVMGCASLPEAFLHISKRLGGSFGVFLERTSQELEKCTGETFGEVFRRCASCYVGDAFPGEEYERFLAFGDELGFLDSDTQKQKLKLYEQELSAEIAKLRQEAPGKQKLCRGLGIYGGLLLAILVF